MNTATDNTQEQAQEPKPFDGTIAETFFFREKKKDGKVVEPKRAEFKATIPAENADTLLNKLLGSLEQAEDGTVVPSEQGAKMLGWLVDRVNDSIYSEAQGQINAKLESISDLESRIAYVLSQQDLDQSKLTFEYLITKPKAERPGRGPQFAEELIAAAGKSFIEFAIANIKGSNGQLLPREKADNAAKEIFIDRFKNTKTNKPVLELFQARITLWLAGIPQADAEQFAELAKYLFERLNGYLNPDQASIIGKFD